MNLKIYERLSQVYDFDWGKFSEKYLSLIAELLEERGIKRARILDLACGTGTLAVELAKLGHHVHGIDISPEMIEKANSKSAGLANLTFEVQDMTGFSVGDRFDLVTYTFDSINYLVTPDSVEQTFCRVAGALRKSGLFIFDSNTDRLYRNRHKGTQPRELGGESFVQKCIYDEEIMEAKTIFEFSDGAVEIHTQRPYDLLELKPLLSEAGLQVIHTFADFDKKPFDSGSERLICVAQRRLLDKG